MVLVGVEQGIVLAMVLSLLRVVRHSYRPHTGVLVPGPKGKPGELVPAVPGAMTEPGLVIYRFGAALFYANAGRFSDEIRGLVGPAPSPVRWLVVDAEAITNIDYTAARVVRQLHDELTRSGVELAFARVPASLKADLDRHRPDRGDRPSSGLRPLARCTPSLPTSHLSWGAVRPKKKPAKLK